MTAQQVIIGAGVVILLGSASLTLLRMTRGPSILDRVVAADVMIAIVILGLGMEASVNQHTTTLPIMVVLSLVGFAGALSMARFVAVRDQLAHWTPAEDDDEEEVGDGGDPA